MRILSRSIFVLSVLIIVTNCEHWGYPSEQPNGVVSDNENWGGECNTGRKQSPVDLAFDASVKGHFPMIMFTNYDQPIKNASVINTGHSVQINIGAPPEIVLGGGGFPGQYLFDQMHFHWGSEHTINKQRYGLELHMVHHEQRFVTIADAAREKNGIAVLGILFHVSGEPNPALDKILESTDSISHEVGKSELIKEVLSPSEFLPKNITTYFRYEGSLTTPGCGEAVVWTVFTDSLPISIAQIEKFKSLHADNGNKLTNNFRSLQPLNARPLVLVVEENSKYMGSGASLVIPVTSINVLLLAFIMQRFA